MLLFTVVMEEETKECRKGDKWKLLYVDDLILTVETKEKAERKLRDQMQAINRKV